MTTSRSEDVTMALLVTLGASALGAGFADAKLREFEKKFGVVIDADVVASVIKKMSSRLDGNENVVVVDGNDDDA